MSLTRAIRCLIVTGRFSRLMGRDRNWYLWMTEDQRFVTGRKDVAVWTMPLDHDLTVTGDVVADIFVSDHGQRWRHGGEAHR